MVLFDLLELRFRFTVPHLVSSSPEGFLEFVSKSVSKTYVHSVAGRRFRKSRCSNRKAASSCRPGSTWL